AMAKSGHLDHISFYIPFVLYLFLNLSSMALTLNILRMNFTILITVKFILLEYIFRGRESSATDRGGRDEKSTIPNFPSQSTPLDRPNITPDRPELSDMLIPNR
ncbi:hypothetical protein ACJX0J_036263, partial [Zea mays]